MPQSWRAESYYNKLLYASDFSFTSVHLFAEKITKKLLVRKKALKSSNLLQTLQPWSVSIFLQYMALFATLQTQHTMRQAEDEACPESPK